MVYNIILSRWIGHSSNSLQWRIQDFGSGGVKFHKFRPKSPILCNVNWAYTLGLHEMIEINLKIEICKSRTQTLETLSMISLEVDFVNIYYKIFNNTAIIYRAILK